MNKDEVQVGQTFRDNDHRVSYPYFTVKKIVKGKAQGKRTKNPDGTGGGRDVQVSIHLERLINSGSRGYTLVQAVPGEPASTPAPVPELTPTTVAAEVPTPESQAPATEATPA